MKSERMMFVVNVFCMSTGRRDRWRSGTSNKTVHVHFLTRPLWRNVRQWKYTSSFMAKISYNLLSLLSSDKLAIPSASLFLPFLVKTKQNQPSACADDSIPCGKSLGAWLEDRRLISHILDTDPVGRVSGCRDDQALRHSLQVGT